MPFIHGKNADFGLGTAAAPSTLTDITAYLTEVGFPRSADQVETTTLGANDKTYIAGYKDQSISLSGRFDPTSTSPTAGIDQILSDLFANQTQVSFAYRPAGGAVAGAIGSVTGTTASPAYVGDSTAAAPNTGGCIVTGYDVTSGVGDVIGFSATLLVTGPVVRRTA